MTASRLSAYSDALWIYHAPHYKNLFQNHLFYSHPRTNLCRIPSIPLYPSNIPIKGSFLFRNSGRSLDDENFPFLISKVSNKPNTRITRVVLVRKYSALQEQPCGSSLSCPRSAEHIKSYLPNFKLQISKLKF